MSLAFLIDYPALPLAAFECPSELRRRRGNLNQRIALDLNFN
jgi:hypothetical protein